jgi:hypothetical protein
MQGIPSSVLSREGISLTEANPSDAYVSAENADEVAEAQFGGKILETKLAHLSDTASVPPVDKVVWAVSLPESLPPAQGPGAGAQPRPTPAPGHEYLLVFVDAQTDAYIEGVGGEP